MYYTCGSGQEEKLEFRANTFSEKESDGFDGPSQVQTEPWLGSVWKKLSPDLGFLDIGPASGWQTSRKKVLE